jgi:hypothetical protein
MACPDRPMNPYVCFLEMKPILPKGNTLDFRSTMIIILQDAMSP